MSRSRLIMQDANGQRTFGDSFSNKTRAVILVLLVAIILAYTVFDRDKIIGTHVPPGEKNTISSAELDAAYGLRVSLVAVTAAGGFVDVRMTILDGEKAKPLLSDPQNFPALSVEGVTLQASQQVKGEEIRYEANSTLFLMFPNAGNAVKKGTPVTLRFGDIALEPIVAQ